MSSLIATPHCSDVKIVQSDNASLLSSKHSQLRGGAPSRALFHTSTVKDVSRCATAGRSRRLAVSAGINDKEPSFSVASDLTSQGHFARSRLSTSCLASHFGGRGFRNPGILHLPGPTFFLQRHTIPCRDISVAAQGRTEAATSTPTTAKDAVELGLKLYKAGKVGEALTKFNTALALQPNALEAQAALYNKACCHAAKSEGAKAQEALREALGKYQLSFSTILSDPDLAPFRALPEFVELQTEARKGGAEVGASFRRDLKLITEVQAPFRGVRKFLYVGLGMAAGISTIFTLPRFVAALVGGEGAPGVMETSTNLAINVGGGLVFVALFLWDQRQEERQLERVSRDETLSRLPLRLSTSRVVELNELRGTTRPVILVGKKEVVDRATTLAEKYRRELLDRGVLLVPLIWGEGAKDGARAKTVKRGFGSETKKDVRASSDGSRAVDENAELEEFEARAQETALKRAIEAEKKFKAEAVSPGEWQLWVKQLQQAEGLRPGEDVFLVLRLDGRVRKSGRGMPDWGDLVKELPALDDLLSKLER
eukprot:TRINITY_DN1099_c1_g2_i1.p1 TRINITY_DN1099_c1_g2~~TRINITY_DN1099_c1_g2_i1.p1  ORF type:complete len:541 (+),score=98.68 TRINITY_DN1099_c1_g2_i1:117-1739(+)